MILALIFFIFIYCLLWCCYFSWKVFFSCGSTSSLLYVQTFFLKENWWKQTNQENQLHISTESPKEDFNDTVFWHFVDELKHCNSDMRLSLCLYSSYLVVMVPLLWSSFIRCFALFLFLINLQYFSPLLQD